ncbi:MAG: 3-deoxy-D-manno-octulosonic acid transferase, partial [Polaribacter sp.]|nr:3-deoxy-D-manno-octulosonic acid transferase [Polaribacter sp.]
VDGRKQTFSKIASLKNQEIIWFHIASLGEFEQARPIIEELKSSLLEYKILVTFFSPSGYEIKKNYDLADVICYLPIDSKSNAQQFIGNLQIKFVIFIKYEFWPNFLFELKRNQIPTLLVSGIFRENQLFFKSYGKFMRDALQAFHHFFLQDETSKKLLESIDFKNNTVVGDTRFDRVSKIFQQDNSLDFISEFKNNQYIIVAGSTWKEDEEFLVNYINKKQFSNEKFIIAPHNINKEAIATLRKSIFKKTVLFSEKEGKNLADFDVFIIDTVGILTKIYAAAEVAYVGGGLKTGLHNILEPATFGIPVVIGNKFQKFKEAIDLVRLNGCISISNQSEFSTIFNKLKQDKDFRKVTGNINKKYIEEHLGATQKIMNYLKTKL